LAKPTTAEIADQNARTTPLGLIGRAVEHYACAVAAFDALSDGQPTWTSSGQFGPIAPDGANHLLAMSIEVALKAFLREQGLDVHEIKTKYGHDLIKLLRQAEQRGLRALQPNEQDLLSLLNDLFLSREFEFTVTGARQFPTFSALRELACSILGEVLKTIPTSRNFLNGNVGAYLKRDMNNRNLVP
jgi:hypothetical protein